MKYELVERKKVFKYRFVFEKNGHFGISNFYASEEDLKNEHPDLKVVHRIEESKKEFSNDA